LNVEVCCNYYHYFYKTFVIAFVEEDVVSVLSEKNMSGIKIENKYHEYLKDIYILQLSSMFRFNSNNISII